MVLPGSIVFFGTPRFAVPTLEALAAADMTPLLAVSQPARSAGRGRRVREPAVSLRARELGVGVSQVETVREPGFLEELQVLDPWLGVVVAFGQIFPQALLDLPDSGCVNLHASLLPKYRGAAPVQAAIAAGETVTGVTTMLMEAGLDSGPILLQEEIAIGPQETTPELSDRLAIAGARLVVRTLEGLATSSIEAVAQDSSVATLAPKLTRSDAEIDWELTATELFDRWRAFTPWPGLVSRVGGEMVKVRDCLPIEVDAESAAPGTIIATREVVVVACGGSSALGLRRLQRPGRSVQDAVDFINGERLETGERFG